MYIIVLKIKIYNFILPTFTYLLTISLLKFCSSLFTEEETSDSNTVALLYQAIIINVRVIFTTHYNQSVW